MANRQSSYRRSYGPGGDKLTKDNYFLITADTKIMKEHEKEQMKALNNRLVSYIDKVHDLETANKLLTAENRKLRNMNKEPENDIAGMYEDELKRLRAKNEWLITENARLQIERDNALFDLEEAFLRVKVEEKKCIAYEKEAISLRKDVDDATIERASLEGKLETQMEQITLEKQVHHAEMENITAQVQPVEAVLLQSSNLDTSVSLLPDLNDAILKVRKQYETFNAKSLEDLDNFYKEKVETLTKQLVAAQEIGRDLRVENTEQRKEIQRLEMELEALRAQKEALERSLENLEQRMAREMKEKEQVLENVRKELENTKQDVGKYLKDYQDLNALKLSLDQEISIYQKLITGEESRLIVTEVDIVKEVDVVKVKQSSPERSSRSSSRHSSRHSSIHSSRHSSRSASRSASRSSSSSSRCSEVLEITSEKNKTEAVVEEMLLEKSNPLLNAPNSSSTPNKPDNKGAIKPSADVVKPLQNETEPDVISVSWKVKGGTVRPAKPFSPDDDAEALYKAMKGFGTDEATIIAIIANRTKAQRQLISSHYLQKYKKVLLKELESDLSGDLKTCVQHLMWKRSVLDAHALRKAIKGLGTDEAVLIEILCTQSSREINDIKKDYNQLFEGRNLEKDIESDTSGAFKTFLMAILKGRRPADSGTVVSNMAEDDAKALFAIQVKNWSPSNPTFLEIFTQRSYQHLWYLFKQCWVKLSAENLMDQIEKECKGDLKRGLKTLIRFSTCVPPVYYATQIHDAVAIKGTEDKQLIYIITTRSEIDLIDVKEEYIRLYKKPLEKTIADEISGNYQKLLLEVMK